MPLYTRIDDVKVRLAGKVRIVEDAEENPNHMPISLLRRLIDEAEGEVEMDLSPRYAAPFQTDAGEAFCKLPFRPTQEVIRTLCEINSVMRALDTDFGSGSAIDASKYSEGLKKRYDDILGRLMKKRDDNKSTLNWQFPPLPGLRLNYMNELGDTGYSGQVLNSSQFGDGDFPSKQINDPSESFWNGIIDE